MFDIKKSGNPKLFIEMLLIKFMRNIKNNVNTNITLVNNNEIINKSVNVLSSNDVINEKKKNICGEERYRYPFKPFWDIAKKEGNTIIVGIDAHAPSAFSSRTNSISWSSMIL